MLSLLERTSSVPDDVQAVAHDVLRHRLILSFEAEAQGVSTNQAVSRLIERVATI